MAASWGWNYNKLLSSPLYNYGFPELWSLAMNMPKHLQDPDKYMP